MEYLIPIVNKLQDVFGAIGRASIDLPQITVVGSQSAGKSSVLENIVGRDFLPRGTGICTRRPLVLQLYCIGNNNEPVARTRGDDTDKENNANRSGAAAGEEWGEFLHLPGQRFYDFNQIREEISRETERVSGRNKGISNKSINLKIFSPHVLNLTLVDLPGITKVPTGDQPEDVEEQIRGMCMEFISNPNAIILAVTAANSDLANSDGLKMARAIDPDGERTIGVLTKVDIMDDGTDCSDILSNKVVPLRKGYIAVVNRSQKDIQDKTPIRSGLSKEQHFFQTHHKYRSLLSKCGTANLARTLNQILMIHIRDCLPEIKSKINRMMAEVQMNIDALGESLDSRPDKLGPTLLNIIANFSSSFNDSVDGKGSADKAIEICELYGGARIAYIFKEIFGKSLKNMDPFDGLDDEDIRTAIANATGPRPTLFVSEYSFDLLVRRQIAKLEQPGLQCVDLVFDEMQRMAYQAEGADLTRFPELRDNLFEIVNNLLRDSVAPTQKMISNLVQIELAYINTAHPDFVGGRAALGDKVSNRQRQKQQQQQQQQQMSSLHQQHDANDRSHIVAQESGQSLSNVANGLKSPAPSVAGIGSEVKATNQTPAVSGVGFFNIFKATQPVPSSSSSSSTLSSSMNVKTAAQIEANNHTIMKLPPVPDKMRSGVSTMSEREQIEMDIIKNLISSYFDIVKKNFMDLVPKTIMHFLVNIFKQSLQNELVAHLYKEEVMSELMRETEDVASRRKAYKEMKELLRRAVEIVNEVRDFNTFK